MCFSEGVFYWAALWMGFRGNCIVGSVLGVSDEEEMEDFVDGLNENCHIDFLSMVSIS